VRVLTVVGYPGVASLDILDNVVPHIGGEEEKLEWETSKILGDTDVSSESGFAMPKIPVADPYSSPGFLH
jgi:aspartate-semialdehyde dehydrogenase